MRFLFAIALVLGALTASPAPACEPPPWLNVRGGLETRAWSVDQFGFNEADPGDNQHALTTRARLAVDARLVPKVYARLEGQAFRLAGETMPYLWKERRDQDVRQAYLEAIDLADGRLEVRLGRQVLDLGAGRVLAADDWQLVGRAHDAARLAYRLNPKTSVTGYAIKVSPFSHAKTVDGTGRGDELAMAWGLAATLRETSDWAFFDRLEPLVFYQDYDDALARSYLPQTAQYPEGAGYQALTLGLRAQKRFGPDWDLEMEAHYQTGAFLDQELSAHMLHAGLSRRLPWRALDRAEAAFSLYSGDERPDDGEVNTYQPLFPRSFGPAGLIGWFGLKNLRVYKVGLSGVLPLAIDWRLDLFHFRVDDPDDPVYLVMGKAAGISHPGVDETELGFEADLVLRRELGDHLELEATASALAPGDYIHKSFARDDRDPGLNTMLTLGLTARF